MPLVQPAVELIQYHYIEPIMPQHSHDHHHDHSHAHAHRHAPGERHPHAEAASSLLRFSVAQRLLIALALSVAMWLTVGWAIGWGF
jgi:ABC-type Zn2+ transport system substrate-binding protein/surface adhesin